MGRPKRKRQNDGHWSSTDPTCTCSARDNRNATSHAVEGAAEDAHSSSGNTSSKSRRKRARMKKKRLKKANQRKQERMERVRISRSGRNIGNCNADLVPFTVNHVWLDDTKPSEQSNDKAGPRDCYDECLSKLNSARSDTRTLIFSWLNELSWYRFDASENDNAVMPVPQNGHVDALLKQLGGMKDCMWPAAVRCAAAHNANNFDQRTPEDEFIEARRVCNQFEWLGEGQRGGLNTMFVNRSAIKLANMDALLDFSLISPTGGDNTSGPFVFVDLCGAPGGFSEYVMYRCTRRGLSCRGYGMSLSGENEHGNGIDWKLGHSRDDGTTSNFSVCYGADGTGDIYRWENVTSLFDTIAGKRMQNVDDSDGTEVVDRRIKTGQVHLVVADGGFDAQRDSSFQEKVAQRIIIAQAAAALELLRHEGTLVMKMFGHQTIEMRRLVVYLSRCFEKLTLLKPVSSRPASAERYLVCKSFSGVESSWDGRAWADDMLRSSSMSQEPAKDNSKEDKEEVENSTTSLGTNLDTVDADIARLNVKACSRILSYLESKAASVESGGLDDDDDEEEGTNEAVSCYQTIVDTLAYRHAWQLNTRTA